MKPHKIKFTRKEKARLKKARKNHEELSKKASESHAELRRAIIHPWCNRCKHIINFHCNCELNYDETIAPTGFEPK